VLAPDFDKDTLPPLPRRTTKVEQEKPRLPKPGLPHREERVSALPPPIPGGRPGLPARREEDTPPLPARRSPANGVNGGGPPPVPTGSRPSLAAINSSKPKPSASCLLCRDFRQADEHAAKYPKESLPNVPNLLTWLAKELTAPFDNRTDKARAIFTWLHHNVAYDCDGFFRGNSPLKGQYPTPEVTLRYGVAVCAGYAMLFVDLAERAGLRAKQVVGHGKGMHLLFTVGGS
jgi:transglutaminase-like putative cysteine protease